MANHQEPFTSENDHPFVTALHETVFVCIRRIAIQVPPIASGRKPNFNSPIYLIAPKRSGLAK